MREELSSKARLQSYLDLEGALALAQGELGVIPQQAAKNIAENCKVENIDLDEMDRIYREIGHGFVPLIKVLVKACDKESGKMGGRERREKGRKGRRERRRDGSNIASRCL